MIAANLREAGHTRRFHIHPTIGFQTVAEHSFHVAMLCTELYQGKPSANLLKAALYHDLGESVTGDVPGHIKWKQPKLTACLEALEEQFMVDNDILTIITSEEEIALKLADALELAFYCCDQLMLGNRGMADIYNRITEHINRIPCHDTPLWLPLLSIIERLGEKHYAATKELR